MPTPETIVAAAVRPSTTRGKHGYVLTVRLTHNEDQALRANAASAGLSLSALVRQHLPIKPKDPQND